jgi:hypothetical protein
MTLALLVLTAIIWYLFEKQALRGSADRRHDQKRQAEILAAERAVGEI